MGNFRYCKKYIENSIEERIEITQEVKERIIGYIWKELNNNKDNKILIGPLSIKDIKGEKLEMNVDVDIVREKKSMEEKHVLIESPTINISLDNLNKTDNDLKIKSKTKKIETINDDDLFEDIEEIKFEEKDERIKIQSSYPEEVSIIDENKYNNITFKQEYHGIWAEDDISLNMLDEKLIQLIENGENIKAIKLYRQNTKEGLIEGKKYIDNLIQKIDSNKKKDGFNMLTGIDAVRNLGISVKQMKDIMSVFGGSSMIDHQYLNSFLNNDRNNNDILEELSKEEQDEDIKKNTRKFLENRYKKY